MIIHNDKVVTGTPRSGDPDKDMYVCLASVRFNGPASSVWHGAKSVTISVGGRDKESIGSVSAGGPEDALGETQYVCVGREQAIVLIRNGAGNEGYFYINKNQVMDVAKALVRLSTLMNHEEP